MLQTLDIYRRLLAAHLRGQMQYKVSFILRTIGTFGGNFLDFAGIAALFSRIPHLANWSLPEVALLFGLSSVCFSTAELFGGALDGFDTVVVQGTFDRVLTRPLGTLFQVLTEEFALRRAGRIAQGGVVLTYGLLNAPVSWTPDRIALLLVALLSGTALFFGVFVISAAFCFWVVQGKEAMNVVTYGGDFMSGYPLDIYANWLKRFATFILPLAFVSYYPTLYLLNRPDPLNLPPFIRLLSPLAALVVCLLATYIWQKGTHHYQSTGT
jgi:ABC-2 type transport system permease protein